MGTQRLVIGAPVFNEEEGIEEFLNQVDRAATEIRAKFPTLEVSLLLVDDGSTDQTLSRLQKGTTRGIQSIKIFKFSKNFGHTAAVCALVNEAESDALILMDADLQDDPQILVNLVQEWQKGFLSVRVRRGRRKEGHVFSLLSKVFYRIFGTFTGLQSHLGIFGIYDRQVYEALRRMPEIVRYHPGLLSLVGFKTQFIEVDRAKRLHGESRVGFLKLIKLANQAIFSFSTIPVLVVTVVGLLISLTSFAAGVMVVGIRLFSELAIPGWASILGVQLFLTGLVIFSLGIIGQYIAIIVEEVKRRPKYFVESIIQIESKS